MDRQRGISENIRKKHLDLGGGRMYAESLKLENLGVLTGGNQIGKEVFA